MCTFEGIPKSVIVEDPSHGIFHSVRHGLPLEEIFGCEFHSPGEPSPMNAAP